LVAIIALAAVVVVLLLVSPGERARPHRHTTAHAARPASLTATRWSRRLAIGRSVQQRRIDAIELKNGGAVRTVLVVGCIHGNEPAGIAIAGRLAASSAPRGSALWIVPDLNPDGVAAGTRPNTHGVDLNRNFPWHWRTLGRRGDQQYSGPRPLSEPEARAAYELVLRVRPQISIWFHQPQTLVDLSGGTPAIERRFANLVRLPLRRLERHPGSAVSWENALLPGSTAFVVELPPGSLTKAAITRYASAVLTLANPATAT
jgi:protein MpaA